MIAGILMLVLPMSIGSIILAGSLGFGAILLVAFGVFGLLIIAGILGGIAILTLICIATYALVYLPRVKQAQESNKATVDAQNTQVAVIIEQTRTAAAIAAFTDTPTSSPVPPTVTETLVPTQVVAVATTPVSPFFTFPPETATALALLETLNAVPGTPTQSQRATGTHTAFQYRYRG